MIRDDFPFFQAQSDIVYLDNAATTHKPQCVIDCVMASLVNDNTNVHRSSYGLASRVTSKFEKARETVARFVQADDAQSIIWTKGATDSLNLFAQALQLEPGILCGTEILLLESEHHANLLPWQRLAQYLGLRITYQNIDFSGGIDYSELINKITDETALVAFAHVSNALGCILPVAELCAKARQCNAVSVVDGTQALAHFPVSVSALDCDIYVSSGHKMFAPMGIGFAYIKPEILAKLPPVQLGGEMVKHVTLAQSTWQAGALKFEAGTPNVPGVLALASAVNYISEHRVEIKQQESLLYDFIKAEFAKRPRINLFNHHLTPDQHVPVFSFTVKDVDAYDILRILDEAHIALRVGHHCAMPLTQALGIPSSCRISLCAYNTLTEVKYFFTHLDRALALLASQVTESNKAVPLQCSEQLNKKVETERDMLPLASQFSSDLTYEQVLRLLMLASKQCPLLEQNAHISQNHVAGCEVDVWLAQDPQTHLWQGYANSKIIRGLLAILLEKVNSDSMQNRGDDSLTVKPTDRQHPKKQDCAKLHSNRQGDSSLRQASTNLTTYLQRLGILRQLSQSRVDGLQHVIARLSV